MDDVHFFLRHAMTGAVFVIFMGLGLSFFGGSILDLLPANREGDWPVALAALAIIGFPMIGITIQGAHYCFYALRQALYNPSRMAWFADPARIWVAATVRNAIRECEGVDCSDVPIDWKFIKNAPDDAFFVWLYHDSAAPQMIEWARRRRSYYYLGRNWVTAAIAGVGAALLLNSMPTGGYAGWVVILLTSTIWAAGAFLAAERMRRDADTMEAIWAASQIDPQFRDCIRKVLPLKSESQRQLDR